MRIDKVTIAVKSMDSGRLFYSAVFDIELKQQTLHDQILYGGEVEGLEVLLCPRSLARVSQNIDNNTMQLRFVVRDVAASLQRGVDHGGTELSGVQTIDGRPHAALRDPDGNSLELVELD